MATPNTDVWVDLGGWLFGSPASVLHRDTQGLFDPPGTRGADVVLPRQNGVKPRRRRKAPIEIMIVTLLKGNVDANGVPIGDPLFGLESHMAALDAAVRPNTTIPYTRTLTHHRRDGSERTAEVMAQVAGSRLLSPRHMRVVVDVIIPDGIWTEVV